MTTSEYPLLYAFGLLLFPSPLYTISSGLECINAHVAFMNYLSVVLNCELSVKCRSVYIHKQTDEIQTCR